MQSHHDNSIEYVGPERRHSLPLTEEQIETIAERAADRAVAKMRSAALQEVGKWTLNKLTWIATIGAVGLYFWLLRNGWIKP